MTQQEYDALRRKKRKECEKEKLPSRSGLFRLRLLLALVLLIGYMGPGQKMISEETRDTIGSFMGETYKKEQWKNCFVQILGMVEKNTQ